MTLSSMPIASLPGTLKILTSVVVIGSFVSITRTRWWTSPSTQKNLLSKFSGHDLFLVRGDTRNFRHDIWPDYKANRKDRRRPPGYGAFLKGLSEYARKRGWLTGGFKGVEGDDVLGLLNEPGAIICSGDKDMLTLPGQHYRNDELIVVKEWDANVAFYKQSLVGDTSDNYPGCPKIGDKNPLFRSKEWLTATTEKELWAQVLASIREGRIRRAVCHHPGKVRSNLAPR